MNNSNKKPTKSKSSAPHKVPEPVEKKARPSGQQGYSFFDYALMISFGVLITAMFYLKFAEDSFVQSSYKVEDSVETRYYKLFGLEPLHNKSEIEKRYHELSKIW